MPDPDQYSAGRIPKWGRLLLGLALGTAGGALFQALSLPLPWMLGALCVTMFASVAGVPVEGPAPLRPAVVAIIGVLLGSRFTADFIGQTGQTLVTLAILMVYLLVVAAVVVPFYRFIGKQSWTTAYLSGMPGGLSEMIEMGEAQRADVPSIILAHSLRIVLTIGLMAFVFRIVLGHDVGAVGASATAATGWPGPWDAAVLVLCAVIGSALAQAMRWPAPTFLGPLFLSALAHIASVTHSAPPALLVGAAQVLLGTILGCRFYGIAPARLVQAGALSLGATALTLILAFGGAVAMAAATGIGVDQGLLALAPGGLTEMGLIALAIHADVAFVALHHVVRILVILLCVPVVFRLLPSRWRQDDRP